MQAAEQIKVVYDVIPKAFRFCSALVKLRVGESNCGSLSANALGNFIPT
jgi:hypothetical protein